MNFRVGQKVVCIDPVNDLVRDRIYTIIDIHIDGGKEFLNVDQTKLTCRSWSFLSWRFRPVVERKTDISFAHEILRKATKPAPSPAVALHHQ